eukprot:9139048-Pyramimonas_sp.AAC.1
MGLVESVAANESEGAVENAGTLGALLTHTLKPFLFISAPNAASAFSSPSSTDSTGSPESGL